MIAKRIDREPKNDNYYDLAMYVADARNKGEKLLFKWQSGCLSDEFEEALIEIGATQSLNKRSQKEKTYHLMISFRPQDEDRFSEEMLRQTEEAIAAALGFSEHQRVCAVHVNTANPHIHVAYNMIHPEKHTRHEPFQDFYKLNQACREIEKRFGLVEDRGVPLKQEPSRVNQRAAAFEAHSGQQSFEGFARDQGEALLAALETAQTWEDVHCAFARHGLEVKPRSAGLVVKDRHGRHMAKASSVHRNLSLKKLEACFGAFQSPRGKMPESERRYGADPLHKAPNRNQLWQEFQEQRKSQKAELEEIREKWEQHRMDLQNRPIARRTRANLMKMSRQYEAEEVHAARMGPRTGNWLDFLRQKAGQGDETALAVLRSRKEEVASELTQRRMQARAAYLASKTAILENAELSTKTKNRLISVALMESLASGTTARISKIGSIIFTLPDGEKICDTGSSISFSDEARETALDYMTAKWGIKRKRVSLDRDTGDLVYTLANGQKVYDRKGRNVFERSAVVHRQRQLERERPRNQGMER